MEPFKISMKSLPVEITHIRFLAFIGVYLFTVIFYIDCFKIVDLGICVMYQSTPSVAFSWGLSQRTGNYHCPMDLFLTFIGCRYESEFFQCKRGKAASLPFEETNCN